MIKQARYAHTNLVARDWRKLARFYEEVFGCVPLPPERDYSGKSTDAVTGVEQAHVWGVHLKLPGFEASSPTLEIFQYSRTEDKGSSAINQPGFAHIAFEVESVEQAREEMVAHGGSDLGEMVTLTIATGAQVTLIYMRDPEGNIVELQSWQ
ncbi:MAG: VOC family protein [Verrucomicrobiae bacterium]|nr:VOC family protein [Verrucomicrobiae bacterium]